MPAATHFLVSPTLTWSLGSASWRQRTMMSMASRQPNAWLHTERADVGDT